MTKEVFEGVAWVWLSPFFVSTTHTHTWWQRLALFLFCFFNMPYCRETIFPCSLLPHQPVSLPKNSVRHFLPATVRPLKATWQMSAVIACGLRKGRPSRCGNNNWITLHNEQQREKWENHLIVDCAAPTPLLSHTHTQDYYDEPIKVRDSSAKWPSGGQDW